MLEEDFSVFLDANEFAHDCVILDTQDIITGIFDRPYTDVLDMQGFSPSLLCKSEDIAGKGLRRGTVLQIGDDLWRSVSFEPDGTGMTRIQLETCT